LYYFFIPRVKYLFVTLQKTRKQQKKQLWLCDIDSLKGISVVSLNIPNVKHTSQTGL